MKEYKDLLHLVLNEGKERSDRTGTGTLSLFGTQTRIDLRKGFPLLTTKKLHLKSIIHELLWFIKGGTDTKYLNENGVHIWNEWADENDGVGCIYGHQWTKWNCRFGSTQFDTIIDEIKLNPNSRRLIMSAWNCRDLDYMSLPPCHVMFQFYIQDGELSCHLYQRSADLFLGVPFNIASYSLLMMMIAQVCNLQVGDFIHSFGDIHLYKNHIEQAKQQLSRDPKPLPNMKINPKVKSIYEFKYEDFTLSDYNPHPHIKAEISV